MMYCIDETSMRNLQRVMRRLYDETLLKGDERRDLANTMWVNLDAAIPLTDGHVIVCSQAAARKDK
jgi:hypothetical protein